MGHGNGIKWYQHIQLPGTGIEAATTCLAVDPARPPGSSDEFYAAATRLGQRAQALRDVLDKLRRIDATEGVWTGDAADAFRSVLRDAHRAHYDQVPTRYDGYARALRQYATTLSGHQSAIDGARADVQATLDAYHRAKTSITPPKVAPDCPPFPNPVSGLLPQSPACTPVIDDCLAAARRFQLAYNEWVDAVTTCEHAIERVDDDKLHNPHGGHAAAHALNVGFHTALDLTAQLADLVASLSAVLAVLTLWNPALAGVLLEISTFASMVKLDADQIRKVAYHENVSLNDLAFDALGSIPGAKPTVEGVAAARGLKGARLISKLRVGAGKFQKTFADEFLPSLGEKLGKLTTKDGWRVTTKGLGRAFVFQWDVVSNGPSVARDTLNNHKKGWLPALEGAALGPLAPVVVGGVRKLDKEIVPIRGPRLPWGR